MSHTRARWGSRITAAVGAAALALIGVVVGTGSASAATTPPVANINPEATGSILVHKYEQPSGGAGQPNQSGNPITPPSTWTALAGVGFKVQQVDGVDLTTNAGWVTVAGLTVDATGTVTGCSTNPCTLSTPASPAVTSGTTDSTGLVSFTSLPLGVYVVTETSPGSNPIVAPAVPFLVTVPMPNSGEWNYTVNAYPKNAVQGVPVKSVDDSTAHTLGDPVTWTVTSTVPTLNQGATFSTFDVTDALDTRLTYVSVPSVTLAKSPSSSVPVPAADYTVNFDSTSNTVTVTFTAAGLTLLGSSADQTLTVVIDTTVNAVGNGIIANVASVNGVKSNSVNTQWGNLIVQKYGTGTNPLQGAVFGLYLPTAGTSSPTCGTTLGTLIQQETSDANGLATWPGLKVGSYCVQEISAPAGWNVDPYPHLVNITAGTTTTPGLDVTDTQATSFTLPMTGAAGTVMFTIIGLSLLAGGVALVLITRRRAAGRRPAQQS